MSSFNEFKQSLDELVHMAQRTANLGLDVAKEQVETLVKNPNLDNLVRNPNVNEQLDEVRRNLQTMAREMETRTQELVHLATSFVQSAAQQAQSATVPRSNGSHTPPQAAPSGHESATAAGAGTAQHGSNSHESTPTPNGEVPQQ